jgi:hypothetical protein
MAKTCHGLDAGQTDMSPLSAARFGMSVRLSRTAIARGRSFEGGEIDQLNFTTPLHYFIDSIPSNRPHHISSASSCGATRETHMEIEMVTLPLCPSFEREHTERRKYRPLPPSTKHQRHLVTLIFLLLPTVVLFSRPRPSKFIPGCRAAFDLSRMPSAHITRDVFLGRLHRGARHLNFTTNPPFP